MTQTKVIPFEEAPFRLFHFHVAFSAAGGEVADGFELGIIGIALSMAVIPLHLTAVWLGILGAAAMVGLFIGSVLTGVIVDRYGRFYIYGYNMLFMAIISGCQFFATKPWELLVLRLILGMVLGTDWVVAKAVAVEFTPTKYRGRVGSTLALTWTFGYAFSYVVGFMLRNTGPNAWRYMLAISSIPAACIFLFRIGIPESPLWLMKQGKNEEAIKIVLRKLGPNFALPTGVTKLSKTGGEWAQLISKKVGIRLTHHTPIGCGFTEMRWCLKVALMKARLSAGLLFNCPAHLSNFAKDCGRKCAVLLLILLKPDAPNRWFVECGVGSDRINCHLRSTRLKLYNISWLKLISHEKPPMKGENNDRTTTQERRHRSPEQWQPGSAGDSYGRWWIG